MSGQHFGFALHWWQVRTIETILAAAVVGFVARIVWLNRQPDARK